MIVRVQVSLPADGIWDLKLPEIPPESEGKQQFLEEWVWKHGKDQLLSKLVFSTLSTTANESPDDTKTAAQQEEKEEAKEEIDDNNSKGNSNRSNPRTSPNNSMSSSAQRRSPMRNHRRRSTGDNNCSECSPPRNNSTANISSNVATETIQQQKQRLDLVDKLQTVQQDFLERVQGYDCLEDVEEQEEEGDDPLSFPNNPTHIALRELLDSVLEWSGTDYGFVAGVEQHKVVRRPSKGETMNDVSELDCSDMGDHLYDHSKVWKVGPKVAAVNVPYSNRSEDKEWYSDSSLGDHDDSSVEDDEEAADGHNPLQRQPQPITTYGPVHYKNIPGSLTLMMDQLRFEPVNPLDLLHEGSDEDNSEQSGSASHEYNYMEVYWDKVEKYQLTPTTSTKNHLFKLIVRKDSKQADSTKRTTEVILKMRSRTELERIAEDVKTRVVLPSRRKKKKPKDPPRRRRRRRRRRDDKVKAVQNSESPSSVTMTPRERSVMMPPSLPQRMTSDRNLLVSSSGHSQDAPLFLVNNNNAQNHNSPAPRPPVRKLTGDDLVRDLSFVDDSSDYYDDSESDDDDDGDGELYAIQDLVDKCRHLRRPLTYKARKRDKKLADDPTNKEEEALALLPKQWQRLVVLPIFESKECERMESILVLSLTGKNNAPLQQSSEASIDFASKKGLDGWVPAVTTMMQDFWQHKLRLEQLSKASKTVFGLRGQLKDSLRRHSDMIHGILPPMAIAKLKVQPQQWKSPLQHQGYYHSHMNASKPSAIVPLTGAASVDDSSISGSIHSRYSLLMGASSLDSNSTLQTLVPGGPHSTDGLPRVAENTPTNKLPERSASTKTAQQKGSASTRNVPQRTNSVGNNSATIRGLQQHLSGGSMPGKTAMRPVFNRMDSKRSMMMQAMRQATGSARGAGLMRMDSAKRGNLIKMDSARFGRGITRLNSLRSLHTTGLSVATSGASVDTTSLFEQSWRTMYTDDEHSLHPEDFSQHCRTATQRLGALSQDVSYLTSEASVRYINSSFVGGMKHVQALYAGRKSNVSIVVVSMVNFPELSQKLKVSSLMDVLAKLQFTVDRVCDKHRTIKVESIGTKIVIMSGLFVSDSEDENGEKRNNNSEERARQDKRAAIAALEMAKEVVSEAQTIEIPKESSDDENKKSSTDTMKVRVGIHVGDVKYGVLGQNVPHLNCFGENNDVLVALRMEQTAPDNCIRVSKCFRDLVGDSEREWEKETEMVEICCHNNQSNVAQAATTSISESTASAANGAPPLSIETFSLEPPPPAISGANCASVTSFASLAPFGSSDFLQISDHGGMLGVQLEESFISGEFDVD